MQSLARLEASAAVRPNSIEIHQALADAYIKEERWEEAAKAYRTLLALYPATALLFINRIRLGASALALACLLILLAQILQPPLPNAVTHPTEFATAIRTGGFLTAQLLLMLALPLWSTAAISIYKLLSYSSDHRPAFWAMVCSVLGVALAMPGMGINAIILPLIGRLYLDGDLPTLGIYLALQSGPWPLILHLGSFVLLTGILIFAIVIWRNPVFSKIPVSLFLLGWGLFVASGNQLPQPGLWLVGFLIALGGLPLARSIWQQAALQFQT